MERFEISFAAFWSEEGILFGEFTKPSDMSLEMVKEIIDLRHQASKGQKQYWCLDLFNLKSFRKEARDYVGLHGQDMLLAMAVIIRSHSTNFFVNIFLRIKKPHIPFKAFKDKAAAIKWLREQQAINEAKGITA